MKTLHPFDSLRRYSLVLTILVGLFCAVGLWSYFYRIDQVTRGTGTVIVSSRVQVIQSVDGGVIDELRAKEGDRVKEGDILATLEKTKVEAALQEVSSKVAALQAQAARLQAQVLESTEVVFPPELTRYPDLVRVQRGLFNQIRHGYQEEVKTLKVAVALATDDANLVRKLAANGDISRSEVIRVERALNDAQAQLVNRQNKYFQDARAELAKVEDDLGQSIEVQRQRKQQLDDTVFRANLPGIVKNVRVTTKGGVLRAGDELMQIVPVEDEMIVEAKVIPADIASIRSGLDVNVRFDAFDYTVYGVVKGKVKYVSADTLKEEVRSGEQYFYRVHVVINGSPVTTMTGRVLEILPGMTAQVDIRTGDRSVFDYLLKPVRKTLVESMGER